MTAWPLGGGRALSGWMEFELSYAVNLSTKATDPMNYRRVGAQRRAEALASAATPAALQAAGPVVVR